MTHPPNRTAEDMIRLIEILRIPLTHPNALILKEIYNHPSHSQKEIVKSLLDQYQDRFSKNKNEEYKKRLDTKAIGSLVNQTRDHLIKAYRRERPGVDIEIRVRDIFGDKGLFKKFNSVMDQLMEEFLPQNNSYQILPEIFPDDSDPTTDIIKQCLSYLQQVEDSLNRIDFPCEIIDNHLIPLKQHLTDIVYLNCHTSDCHRDCPHKGSCRHLISFFNCSI